MAYRKTLYTAKVEELKQKISKFPEGISDDRLATLLGESYYTSSPGRRVSQSWKNFLRAMQAKNIVRLEITGTARNTKFIVFPGEAL